MLPEDKWKGELEESTECANAKGWGCPRDRVQFHVAGVRLGTQRGERSGFPVKNEEMLRFRAGA